MSIYTHVEKTNPPLGMRTAKTVVPPIPNITSNSSLLEVLGQDDPKPSEGIPFGLQQRLRALTGIPFDDVKVHHHSVEAVRLSSPAFVNGSEIYLAPGQDHELSHELGHIVQQKLGNVKESDSEHGVRINRDPLLELEADQIGAYIETDSNTEHPELPIAETRVTEGEPVLQMSPKSRLRAGGIGALIGLLGMGAVGLLTGGLGLIPGATMAAAGAVGATTGTVVGGGIGALLGGDPKQYKRLSPQERRLLSNGRKTYSNKQPDHYAAEQAAFRQERKRDSSAYIESLDDYPGDFIKAVKRGERFLWTLGTDMSLKIGSPKQSQHPVVAGGEDVLSAGSGILKQNPKVEAEKAEKWLIDQIKKDRKQGLIELAEAREEMLQEIRADIAAGEYPDQDEEDDLETVILDLQSGHYAPDDSSQDIAAAAWQQTGFKAQFKDWRENKKEK